MTEPEEIETPGPTPDWEAPRLWPLDLADAEFGAGPGPGDGGGLICS
jgi:hypothetical protein